VLLETFDDDHSRLDVGAPGGQFQGFENLSSRKGEGKARSGDLPGRFLGGGKESVALFGDEIVPPPSRIIELCSVAAHSDTSVAGWYPLRRLALARRERAAVASA